MTKRWARALAAWLLRWAGEAPKPADEPLVVTNPARPADRVLAVIEYACFLAGVNTSHFGPALDLSQSGKVPEVIYITARELGPVHPLQSVGAIHTAFTR